MRTSMNLPDALLEQARQCANETGRTVTSLVEEALRKLLAEHQATSSKPSRRITTDGLPRGRLLVDVTDRDAVWRELDRA
ncbi:CopG family transcriptional regulator [Skermania sp. ID1734]|uniref:type II toxin-antitoxin system VapB family antitoxin n=1 Tax=Skermania sp. ID1734 TaxID=2597516 RepID=UPI001181035F|nr:type II toxin-antitoxin system VapB family antitoxin [Skermania sp. ID1734]TSD93953.1 CopG family transcriptional regulator [Skermania sp. ID1734]